MSRTPSSPDIGKSRPRIQRLFGRIAPFYDLCNHLLTLGIDRRWRRRLARELDVPAPARIIDVACGTGDLALELGRKGHRVVGLDFCLPMLERFRAKGASCLAQADALSLPIPDEAADAATVAFGVRNFEDPRQGLAEMLRTLKPGGSLAILEFGLPSWRPLRAAYLLYFRFLLPAIGRLVSGDARAYRYLSDSVMAFPHGEAFEDLLRRTGYVPVRTIPLSLGICYLYLARRPGYPDET